MKIINKDLKKGFIKLKAEDYDDLWYLSEIIEQGDLVSGKTERKIKIGSSDDRKTEVVRKSVFLEVKTEKIELSESSLRVLGTITQGDEDISSGNHHSFTIEADTIISIKKDAWPSYILGKIDNACKTKQRFLLVIFDREDALFALTKSNGFEILAEIEGKVHKKRLEGSKDQKTENFFKKISNLLAEYNARHKPTKIIAASPAFWNDYLMKEITEDIRSKIITSGCNSINKAGITEVMKRPELSQALKDDRASRELVFVQDLMFALSKDMASYSLKDVKKSVEFGAVKQVLASITLIRDLREKNKYRELENILKKAESMDGVVHIIENPDAVKQLDGLGGIGAILRYRVE